MRRAIVVWLMPSYIGGGDVVPGPADREEDQQVIGAEVTAWVRHVCIFADLSCMFGHCTGREPA